MVGKEKSLSQGALSLRSKLGSCFGMGESWRKRGEHANSLQSNAVDGRLAGKVMTDEGKGRDGENGKKRTNIYSAPYQAPGR